MNDTPKAAAAPRSHLPIPQQFVPLIAEIVVLWGSLDDRIEIVRLALVAQPACAGIVIGESSQFNRRLNVFEDLSNTYFEGFTPMQRFVRKACEQIRVLKKERDLFVHGRYGWTVDFTTGNAINLMLNDKSIGRTATRYYTEDKFKELNDHIGMQLSRIWALSYREPNEDTERNYWKMWGISHRRFDQIQKALSPIRDHCQNSIREWHKQSDQAADRDQSPTTSDPSENP